MKANITEQFEKFDSQHPEIYDEFVRRVDQLWNRGIRKYSSDSLLHIIRFHTVLDGRDTEQYKINNNYSAFYARKYIKQFPHREGFFATRQQKAA